MNKGTRAWHRIVASISAFLIMIALVGLVRAELVDFKSPAWTLLDAEVTEYLGRTALMGIAILQDVEFGNGIIEVDIAATTDRRQSYPGIIFRKQGQNYERFYVRPHRSALYSDVLQYTPTINGVAGWQLYSGDGCTEIATIPVGQWIHFKMEIEGSQARLFIDDAPEPALLIPDLKLGETKGAIGVFGPKDGTAYFSNFSYTIDDNLDFKPIPLKDSAFGVITDWELSDPVSGADYDLEKTPDELGLTDIKWSAIKSDASGLVDVCRYHVWNNINANLVWARTAIYSDKNQIREYAFGYSDGIVIFLNGKLLFSGISAYQGRDPSFLGIIGFNDGVYLPLKKGKNELLFAITESFGGWGFMCRDADTVFLKNGVEHVWEIEGQVRLPESAVYDAEKDALYVSNYYDGGGREFISKVTLDGKIEELKWVTGLYLPTGLAIYKDKLYAVERANLVEIDKESGQVVKKYPVPGPTFPNDITFDNEGNGYLSDSDGNKIFIFRDGEIKVWLQTKDIIAPNGVLYDSGRLLVGCSGDGCLKAVDMATQEVTTIVSLGRGAFMDGITPDGQGNYIISDFNGRVFRVTPGGEKTLLINSNASGLYTADLVFISEKNLLVVPRLYSNKLGAYTITE